MCARRGPPWISCGTRVKRQMPDGNRTGRVWPRATCATSTRSRPTNALFTLDMMRRQIVCTLTASVRRQCAANKIVVSYSPRVVATMAVMTVMTTTFSQWLDNRRAREPDAAAVAASGRSAAHGTNGHHEGNGGGSRHEHEIDHRFTPGPPVSCNSTAWLCDQTIPGYGEVRDICIECEQRLALQDPDRTRWPRRLVDLLQPHMWSRIPWDFEADSYLLTHPVDRFEVPPLVAHLVHCATDDAAALTPVAHCQWGNGDREATRLPPPRSKPAAAHDLVGSLSRERARTIQWL